MDKENQSQAKLFFKTLLHHCKRIEENDKLDFQKEILDVVLQFAYRKGKLFPESWVVTSVLTDSSNRMSRRIAAKPSTITGDCFIIYEHLSNKEDKVLLGQLESSVKTEVKVEPSATPRPPHSEGSPDGPQMNNYYYYGQPPIEMPNSAPPHASFPMYNYPVQALYSSGVSAGFHQEPFHSGMLEVPYSATDAQALYQQQAKFQADYSGIAAAQNVPINQQTSQSAQVAAAATVNTTETGRVPTGQAEARIVEKPITPEYASIG